MSSTEVSEIQAQSKVPTDVPVEMDDDSVDNMSEALECLMDGKRHLLCKDIPAAVSTLADACKLMTSECGEKAPQCGEVYYYYGKSLLELARLESAVLGNALSGVPKDDAACDGTTQVEDPRQMTDEECVEIEMKVDEALMETLENCQKAEAPLLKKDGANSKGDAKSEDTHTEKKVVEGEVVDGEAEQESDEEDCEHVDEENAAAHEAEAEEEPSSLQLAWEVLELSKLICKEQLDNVAKKELDDATKAALEKRYCDTYFLLSEVSVESGNYHQAVEDLKLCLQRQKTLLPADSRNIAETLYYLGVALGFHKNYDEALISLNAAVSVLESRMVNLKEKPGTQSKNEATEIKALLPEVKTKIVDMKDLKAETSRKAAELYLIGGKKVDISSKPVSTNPVKNVDCAK